MRPLAQVPAESTSGLDTYAICEAYCELLRLQSSDVVSALMNATDSLLRTLQMAQLSQPSLSVDGAALRQFVMCAHTQTADCPRHPYALQSRFPFAPNRERACASFRKSNNARREPCMFRAGRSWLEPGATIR